MLIFIKMCINQREIENIYTHKKFFVKCGSCPSCLQEKAAHRVTLIKNTKSSDLDVFMLTLTYERGCCPYVFRSDAYAFSHGDLKALNVWRDRSFRYVRNGSGYDVSKKELGSGEFLTSIPFVNAVNFKHCKDLKREPGKIGVCYYPDVQKFVARLRLNLKRCFNYEKPIKTYICSEYGAKSFRPHFHLLIFAHKGSEEILRRAAIKSWSFSDLSKFERAFEKSFRGDSYVASYVNSPVDFPKFLKDYAPPKHSYSKGFGVGLPVFQLPKILEMYRRGTLSYSALKDRQGLSQVIDVPIPAYVLHRYFPKFKAYSRIAPLTLVEVMQGIRNFDYDKVKSILDSQCLYYSSVDFNRISVLLNNAYKRFKTLLPLDSVYKDIDFYNYALLHQRIWRLHSSDVLKLHLLNDDIPLTEKYDNLHMLSYYRDASYIPCGFEYLCRNEDALRSMETDPNKFMHTRMNTYRFMCSYYDNIKHRKVTNTVLSSVSDEW